MGMIRKLGKWVPHQFFEKLLQSRITACKKHMFEHKKHSFFIELLLAMKNGSITTTPNVKQRMLIQANQSIAIKTKYSMPEGYVVHLVVSERCGIL